MWATIASVQMILYFLPPEFWWGINWYIYSIILNTSGLTAYQEEKNKWVQIPHYFRTNALMHLFGSMLHSLSPTLHWSLWRRCELLSTKIIGSSQEILFMGVEGNASPYSRVWGWQCRGKFSIVTTSTRGEMFERCRVWSLWSQLVLV